MNIEHYKHSGQCCSEVTWVFPLKFYSVLHNLKRNTADQEFASRESPWTVKVVIVAYDCIAQLSADNPPVGCTRDEVDQPDNGIYWQWHVTEIALLSEKEMYKMGEKGDNVQSVAFCL